MLILIGLLQFMHQNIILQQQNYSDLIINLIYSDKSTICLLDYVGFNTYCNVIKLKQLKYNIVFSLNEITYVYNDRQMEIILSIDLYIMINNLFLVNNFKN